MLVLKFGGSSVDSALNIEKIKNILTRKKEPFVLVVSALSGITDALGLLAQKALESNFDDSLAHIKTRHLELAKALLKPVSQTETFIHIQQTMLKLEDVCNGIRSLGELSDKTMARVLAVGEELSSELIGHYLNQEGMSIKNLPAGELISANGNYLNTDVNYEVSYSRIRDYINPDTCYIAPGFVAINPRGDRVVLGRGGSDYTAALIAGAIDATALELWSDVNGMLNANPNLVRNAGSIKRLSYKEAFEMAYFGAKVVYPPAIRPVMQKKIPVFLKNTSQPGEAGTLIHGSNEGETNKIIGVSTLPQMAILTISGVGLAGTKGLARRVFQAMEEAGINIVFITQACSEQSICLGIKAQFAEDAKNALASQFHHEMKDGLVNPVELEDDKIVLAVIGDNMKHQVGLSGKIFGALGENNISVKAIAQGASERNISIVLDAKDEHKAVNVIHERFFQASVKKIHLFVAGVGNVGSQFLNILEKQQANFLENHKIELKLVGVANSTKFILNTDGLSFETARKIRQAGTPYSSFAGFVDDIIALNLRNSIVIDNTASEEVSLEYDRLFGHSISVVTCNKFAGSSPISNYQKLMKLTHDKNCKFQYETSVAAALPVIKTIQDLSHSGDRVNRIEAVLSGSLNFIFNNYNTGLPFADIVQQAKDEGYTEPDPKIDLTGLDVMRKILILARESGYMVEPEDVTFSGFLPESSLKTETPEEFIEVLRSEEAHFRAMHQKAQQNNCRLKVVAVMDNGKLSVSLQQVDAASPFYHLDGKDNIVSLFTNRYNPEPLIIKGAGAGAEVTASGVFSDLIFIVNR